MDEKMSQNHRATRLSPEVYIYATSKHFLNIYDALRIDKFKVEIAGYDPTTNRQTGHASAWLDKDDVRLLCHLVCNRLFMQVTGGRWERYGGSQRDDGLLESRNLMVEWDEGEGARFARFPYRITVANGPGRKTETGGVAPAGEPTAKLSMRLPEADMMKLMLTVSDYLHAYESAHHHRIVAERLRALRDKLENRSERYEAPDRQPEFEPQPRPAGTATSSAPRTSNGREQPAPAPAHMRPPLRSVPGNMREARTSYDETAEASHTSRAPRTSRMQAAKAG